MDSTLDAGERIDAMVEIKNNRNGKTNGARKTVCLLFDESTGRLMAPSAHRSATRTDDDARPYDPADWEELELTDSDTDIDWILE
jgi:hypothetical protein